MLTILLVDDEKHVRDTIKMMCDFEKFGITKILEADNGIDALEIIVKEKPHIVITDMKMPFLNGVELLKKSNEADFKGKIIVLSGYDIFEYARESLRQGAFDYLLKPINPFEINDAVKRAASFFSNELPETDFLDEIKAYVEEHFAKEIHLDIFSKKYFMTKEYIIRKYKEKYNTGIYEYLTSIRMSEAKKLLLNSDFQIQEIAYRVGFNDSHYFSKVFKNYFGYSPKMTRSGNINEHSDPK